MAGFFNQDCPLCSGAAEFGWVDSRNRKHVHCPNCTYFQISKTAEKRLVEQPQSRRAAMAKFAANAPEGRMLVIRMPDHEHRLASDDDLQATYVDKSQLPLTVR